MGPEPWDLGTRDPETPSKLKVGPRTPIKFKVGPQDLLQNLKVGPQDPLQSLKVGPPHLSLMNSFFSEYLIVFYLCVFFK